MTNFEIEVDPQGIATITFDVPQRSLNVINQSVQRDLDEIAERLRTDPEIVGAILRSGKASGFCAGADLGELLEDMSEWRACATPDEIGDGVTSAAGLSRRIRALETCGKPVVAIVEGLAMGGGLELVLGCHHRLVRSDADVKVSLPEVSLGLLPGAGGTQRLLRLIGLVEAAPFLLDAKPLSLETALSAKVFHRALPAAELMQAARDWIIEGGAAVAPWDEKGFRIPGGGPHTPAAYAQFGALIAASLEPGKIPAKAAILKCLYEGAQVPFEAGLRIESRYFFNTAKSDEAQRKVTEFLASRSASHGSVAAPSSPPLASDSGYERANG